MVIKDKSQLALIIGLLFLSIGIKLYTISGNDILFIFDQGRDAYVSRQILEAKDLKIIGPSASGSNDKLYHGVLYYYIIGPLYTIFGGNPFAVALILGILNSFAIIPLFLLVKSYTRNTFAATAAAVMLTVSFEAAQLSTWLSNPSLVLLTGSCFYYYLWQTFYDKNPQKFIMLMFFLGLCNQFFLFSIYLWITVLLSALYAKISTSDKQTSIRSWIIGLVVYLCTVATMIAAQVIQYTRGIGVNQLNDVIGSKSLFNNISIFINQIWSLYTKQITTSLLPNWQTISLGLFIFSLFLIFARYSWKHRIFIIINLIGPLAMLSIQPRTAAHTLVGLSILLYVMFAATSAFLLKLKSGKLILIVFLMIFTINNLGNLKNAKNNSYHIFSVQNGSMLKHNLAAIDYTYNQAQSQPFTISTLTNPYLYNTTWAYLYHWYGLTKYGYLPKFVGPSQERIYGNELLATSQIPAQKHFSIIEDNIDLDNVFKQQFTQQQNDLGGEPVATTQFTSIIVETRVQ